MRSYKAMKFLGVFGREVRTWILSLKSKKESFGFGARSSKDSEGLEIVAVPLKRPMILSTESADVSFGATVPVAFSEDVPVNAKLGLRWSGSDEISTGHLRPSETPMLGILVACKCVSFGSTTDATGSSGALLPVAPPKGLSARLETTNELRNWNVRVEIENLGLLLNYIPFRLHAGPNAGIFERVEGRWFDMMLLPKLNLMLEPQLNKIGTVGLILEETSVLPEEDCLCVDTPCKAKRGKKSKETLSAFSND
ncbi:hypothetical protein FB446DRAFT_776590 [Lentinula raphanica]|nr:hypothetical protein FB446DRAFT_776590 [Lentinula raphanica]